MTKSMILGVRSAAGLSPDHSSTSNDGESNSHVLKSAAENEEMSMVDFINLAKSLALNQHQDVIRAVLQSGQYRFKEGYSNLQVPDGKCFQMSKEQKLRHLRKVMGTALSKNKESIPVESLSIKYSASRLAKPPTMLAAIWAKAQEYLVTPGSISVLPSHGEVDAHDTKAAK